MNDIHKIVENVEPEIAMLCRFGSHLYGTNTPDSDTDYKGIFMPTKEMILLGKIPKSINNNKKKKEGEKNTSDDVDFELHSLHYFIELSCKGETAALDMLHVNDENLVIDSDIWTDIQLQRNLFYTKNLKAFVGYARRQAAKYGIKGSRLNTAREFLDCIYDNPSDLKMETIWHTLPVNEHARFIESNTNGIMQYQICGKIIQSTVTVEYAYDIIKRYYKQYGKRAQQASNNDGIDWKAVSHALRAAYQTQEIFTNGTITYPLKEAQFLTHVKQGKLDFTTVVQPELERVMQVVESLSEKSTLPEKVGTDYWNNFIIKQTADYLGIPNA